MKVCIRFHAYNGVAMACLLSKESEQASTKDIGIPGKWEALEIIGLWTKQMGNKRPSKVLVLLPISLMVFLSHQQIMP